MSDDKKSSNSINEKDKIFNGEIFVNNNPNELDFEPNNNSLRKSTSNSNGGSLFNNNNIRGSFKSNHSNNERFLTKSLMQDLRGSSKKFSDKKIEFDKLKSKDPQTQLNNTQISNNSNSNNNEEDILANIKLPKNDNNNQPREMDDIDLYEEVENTENEEIENNNMIYNDKMEEMSDIININQLTKLNEYFNKNKKNNKKNNSKGDSPKNERDEVISLRSSGGSSAHSNNSNGNISVNMNMRSSKIFNKKKDKNSPDKQIDNNINNSNGNLPNLEESNSDSLLKNIISDNENISNNNDNNNNSETNDNTDNKLNKETKEEKEEREKKEMIAKIKDRNNEQNFISKNILNFTNKNINSINNIEDKFELEMQLFNLDSFKINNDKNKETEKIKEENKDTELNNINIFQTLQNLETFIPKEIPAQNIIEKTEDIENNMQREEEKASDNVINEKDIIINNEEKEKEKEKEKKMEKEEYVFEKFGKLGWECEKCNNFNFESRTICNRCEAPKQPKSLEQIKIENEQKSGERKKKPLVERKGDWQCPACHNLNFAFRQSCNRCKLPKEMYINYTMNQQKINEKMVNNINLQNNFVPQMPQTQIINNTGPHIIQNQFNIIQWGYIPMYSSPFPANPFNQVPQPNINNMNNYKRKIKYYKYNE